VAEPGQEAGSPSCPCAPVPYMYRGHHVIGASVVRVPTTCAWGVNFAGRRLDGIWIRVHGIGCMLLRRRIARLSFWYSRTLSGGTELTCRERRGRLNANTNLEEISDWLTKIIVGATLVQLGNLIRHFGTLATAVSSIFGTPSDKTG